MRLGRDKAIPILRWDDMQIRKKYVIISKHNTEL